MGPAPVRRGPLWSNARPRVLARRRQAGSGVSSSVGNGWAAGIRVGASTRAMLMSLQGNIAVPLDRSARSGRLNSAPVHIDLPTVGVAVRTQKA